MNLMHFLNRAITPTRDFFRSDEFPLDDEAVADLAIRAMLLVMQNSHRAWVHTCDLTIDDYGPLVAYGVRFPWKDRVSFSGQIDLKNDTIPEHAVIGKTSIAKGAYAEALYMTRLLSKTPRVSALAGATTIFKVGHISGYEKLSRSIVVAPSKQSESLVATGYAGVMPDGVCVGCDHTGKPSMWWAYVLAYVTGLHNDSRHFWNVTAKEDFMEGLPAQAHFSIDEEYVKSLFYARSLPVTDKGRMRPILHWVRAHKRRIKEGIDIDVRKHLRGIENFAMHDVNFSITQPRKERERRAAISGEGKR